jgi:uncharacterized membrane protein
MNKKRNYTPSSAQMALIILLVIIVTFPLTFAISAVWLSIYEWIKSHGFGFWGACAIYSALATLLAGAFAAARIDRS